MISNKGFIERVQHDNSMHGAALDVVKPLSEKAATVNLKRRSKRLR
jgi:hypothetical protein